MVKLLAMVAAILIMVFFGLLEVKKNMEPALEAIRGHNYQLMKF